MSYLPQLEYLPARLSPGVTPSPLETELLHLLNQARANPPAYGRSIGLNLDGVPPAPPLTADPGLTEAARKHSKDMADRNYFGHYNQAGLSPGGRIQAAGVETNSWGESIVAGLVEPRDMLKTLIIDAGIPCAGHRVHLLAMEAYFRTHNYVGIGIADGPGYYGRYATIDTAYLDTEPAAETRWVAALYRDLLGRNPGQGELSVWSGTKANVVLDGVLKSPEYNAKRVTSLYLTDLERHPDGIGLVAWAGALSAGTSERQVRAALLASGEAFRAAGADATRWVADLYLDVLGREAAAWELAIWSGPARDNRAAVASAVLGSTEALSRRVSDLYRQLLYREPDGAGLNHFIGRLSAGQTEAEAAATLVRSPEYAAKA